MNAIRLGAVGVALLGWAPHLPAQGDLPPAAQEVLKEFEEETAAIDKKAEADIQKWRDRTAEALKPVQDRCCKEAKLDEAVAVRDLIRSLRAGKDEVPVQELPPGAKEIYEQHEKEVDQIVSKAEAEVKTRQNRAAAELKKVQDRFCKEAKLDEAVAVRDLIRNVSAGVATALADPGYVNNAAEDVGKVLSYQVTGVDMGQSIWGTDVFTTGSHLGMAAVHSGVLKAGQQGVVKVTILPGQADYPASTRHGVTSYAYGPWGVSFKVERGYGLVGRRALGAMPDPGMLTGFRGAAGKKLRFDVTGSSAGGVWETGVYTDDSSLAAAAVHAGALAAGQRGVVTVTILPGQNNYPSTTAHGMTSNAWGSWVGSFRVEPAR